MAVERKLVWICAATLSACGGLTDGRLGSVDGSSSSTDADRGDSPSSDAARGDAMSHGDSSVVRDAGSDATEKDGAFGEGGFLEAGTTPFACGHETCEAPLQYCYVFTAGPPPPPAGDAAPDTGRCREVPKSCEPAPSCACIEKVVPRGVSCTDDDGAITVTFNLP
jgi:hypothetical protein